MQASDVRDNYLTGMWRGSEVGSYSRRTDFLYHSTLGSRVTKKREEVGNLEIEVLDVAALRDVLDVGDVEEAVAAEVHQLQRGRPLNRRRHLRFISHEDSILHPYGMRAVGLTFEGKAQISYGNLKLDGAEKRLLRPRSTREHSIVDGTHGLIHARIQCSTRTELEPLALPLKERLQFPMGAGKWTGQRRGGCGRGPPESARSSTEPAVQFTRGFNAPPVWNWSRWTQF